VKARILLLAGSVVAFGATLAQATTNEFQTAMTDSVAEITTIAWAVGAAFVGVFVVLAIMRLAKRSAGTMMGR
jgi:beta-lactamase regulating signal transducer with metallopeptidase domain